MIKTINGVDYQVLPNEFEIVPNEPYNNLIIIPELGKIERIISLLRETSRILNIRNFSHINPTHGGFIPIMLSSTIENVFIHSLEVEQIENTLANIHKIPNLFISKTIEKPSILFVEGGDCEDICEYYNYHDYHVVLSKFAPSSGKGGGYVSFHLSKTDLWFSIPICYYGDFYKEFHYFIRDVGDVEGEGDNIKELEYDNLIDLCIMVKNAGDSFENILRENLHLIDKWTILDTGSTDNTIEIINRVLVGKKRGQLYCEPFINFPESRNRCLELAGTVCKYTLMLDDTYIIKGGKDEGSGGLREFLELIRGDQFATSFSLYVKSNDIEYTSNRIVKTGLGLKYIYKLHEVINPENNINVIVPKSVANIWDYRCDYMENRTMERKQYDIQVLKEGLMENPDDSRNLYYLAQTYYLLKDYETALGYFMERIHHPNVGFIQEKHDSYFEAGRIANFYLKKPWNQCKELYEKAFELDNKRPESQYFIGIHYYLEGDFANAWDYFKRAFDIGYPIHCEFSLKPTLSFFYLPKYLAELCYTYSKNYSLGKEVALFFLRNNQPDDGNQAEFQTMRMWYSIFSLMETMDTSGGGVATSLSKRGATTSLVKPILTFVADGGFGNWTGRDILKRGMGGSETYIVEMARWIQKSGFFRVIVFCRCDEMDIFENVSYLPITEYTHFISHNFVYSTVISRYMEYVPCSLAGNVENVYIVLHDLMVEGTIIPLHPKIKKVFCLSEWHKEQFTGIFPQFAEKTVPFYYGIGDIAITSTFQDKIPYKFIYSSFPNRGLLPLLQMWPRIIERKPQASLWIYCDIDGKWVNEVAPEQMAEIRRLLECYQGGNIPMNIFYNGWVSKRVLMESWMTSDIWFYPTTFLETFCLTALECAKSRVLAITMDFGSLKNTVGDRGILLRGDPMDSVWQQDTIDVIFSIMEDTVRKNELIERNYQWSLGLTWEKRANELIPLLFGDNTVHFSSLKSVV
jgi:tetratricopeptide (TPR) repeat protein